MNGRCSASVPLSVSFDAERHITAGWPRPVRGLHEDVANRQRRVDAIQLPGLSRRKLPPSGSVTLETRSRDTVPPTMA